MRLKLILQVDENSNFEFVNTEFVAGVPIDTNAITAFEQAVYDFVYNTDLLGEYRNTPGTYNLTVDVEFNYIWHADTRTVSYEGNEANIILLDKVV